MIPEIGHFALVLAFAVLDLPGCLPTVWVLYAAAWLSCDG